MKMKYMIRLAVFATVTILLGVLLPQQRAVASEERKSDNRTIQIYARLLKDASEEEVNDYFQHHDDATLIIADKSGGYLSSLTNDVNSYSEVRDENGNLLERVSFGDETVAATIAEVKEYLREQREK
ncbi:hypothetical protein BVE84_04225 [Streptococcus azizii]|uniref:DUF1310 domain-containing protein n=1 Tax=Streptococcus azizii TaxID=1579424 RepID=A0AB36JSH6_9STRE|nr:MULTISPECIES: hypothetical protein [Streptococcus]MBF0775552.1 hypothetical protein [Streptococcus sp. 19428wD3_AN2]ONK27714.1 hypothetical protein BVE85_06005 [Streptococcus azizii]ONK27817.1 hypothetical protein BVE86_03905 [Streptococcus azizii]ONK29893.1 hypothetical protein BVE84_04225 [Streptococcus azizii]TFU84442.1 hypothetical protein E4T83_02000 [Streptococcus sp. AN2]